MLQFPGSLASYFDIRLSVALIHSQSTSLHVPDDKTKLQANYFFKKKIPFPFKKPTSVIMLLQAGHGLSNKHSQQFLQKTSPQWAKLWQSAILPQWQHRKRYNFQMSTNVNSSILPSSRSSDSANEIWNEILG